MRKQIVQAAMTALIAGATALTAAAPVSAAPAPPPPRPGNPGPGHPGPGHPGPGHPGQDWYASCYQLNRDYPHGVGLRGARDRTRWGERPVWNFERNNWVYRQNRHLDYDRDGISCERWRRW
ncbi:hypothetical protein GCM10010201_09100 [Pilimelia columellifera subsp. columellifera]|uniref:Excalibur calcium-binding domain-containing protein n=1 Tax=Pilimelia columellifera subsp. columellifera TaxID=706583 RepID=A0ABN3N619_9ACTN